MVDKGYDTTRVTNIGIEDRYFQHAPRGDLLEEAGLTAECFAKAAVEALQTMANRL